jgi:hypothetical protein
MSDATVPPTVRAAMRQLVNLIARRDIEETARWQKLCRTQPEAAMCLRLNDELLYWGEMDDGTRVLDHIGHEHRAVEIRRARP